MQKVANVIAHRADCWNAARPLPLLSAKYSGSPSGCRISSQKSLWRFNMRFARVLILFAFAGLFAAACSASEGVEAVIKMQKEGISQNVLLSFVQTSNTQYDPTADEIQLMEDSRVPATVIVAMIDKGKD